LILFIKKFLYKNVRFGSLHNQIFYNDWDEFNKKKAPDNGK